ncbi:TonB-dependent receptor [Microbulbifer guangxiensis]|uniref:TonB-dependent receptor n=1 Tax=Microbulbifer guangxiensis TaxID=2904249 RepID=UPI001F00B533|nr:TonB-dependent receptor [Microbulbifer guangxiensis]
MSSNVFQKKLLASGIALALAGAAAPLAFAQEEEKKEKQSTQIEEVEVVGFKASLERAIDAKRYATMVMDSITSEDIGKFPDKNIGDALMRIPGVGIERRFGEADGVSIRGLDPALSLTYLNGQAISTAQWFEGYRPTRGFRSDMLAAELVSALEVYKSPRADLPEGSVGGIVNIKTARPLDLASGTARGSLEYQYSENAERWDPAYSGLYSWKSDDEKFGVLVSASHQERFTTYDAMENYYGAGVAGKNVDPAGDFTNATWGAGHAIFQQERERTAYNFTAQYQPTEQLDIVANYLNFELSADNVNSNYLVVPGRTDDISNVTASKEFPAGNGILKHDSILGNVSGEAGDDYWFGPDSFFRNTNPEAQAFDLDVTYTHDLFEAHAQVGHTEAAGDIIVIGYFGKINAANADVAGLTGDEVLTLDLTGNKLGVDFQGFDPSNPANYPLEIRENNPHIEDSDEETYAQFDLTVPIDNGGYITSVKTGLKYQDHTNERHLYNFTAQIPASLALGNATYADLPVNTGCGQYEETAKGNTLTCLPTLDLEGIRSLSASLTPGNTRERESLSDFYEINEDKLALYAMAEFEYDKLSGNFGVRYVDYELESVANQEANGEWLLGVPTSNDYSEILPSLNVVYQLQDDLLLRGAVARVMSLPNYQDLRNTFSYNSTTLTGSAGNPNLDPWLANQFDLGVEWYFADGALASATYFRKDIESFLFSISELETLDIIDENTGDTVTRQLEVSRTRNGGEASVQGLELQLQTEIAYGFGVSTNYTFTDAEVVDNNGVSGLNLPGNSEDMWNVTGYWENDRYSARLMANHRGEFFNGIRIGTASETEAFTSIDVAFSADVTDNVTLSLQGVNLTGELYRTKNSQDNWDGIFQLINDGGTRWFMNASVKF